MKNEKNLGFIGNGAEYRFVKSLIEDKTLMPEIFASLKEQAFTVDGLRKIIKYLKTRYTDGTEAVTYEDIKYHFKGELKNEEELNSVLDALVKMYSLEMIDGMTTAVEEVTKYLKTQEAIRIHSNAIENLKSKSYSLEAETRYIEQLQSIEGNKNSDDINVVTEMESVLTSVSSEKIPTGLEELDKKMGGGLTKGTVGLVIAGTGIGKSTFAANITNASALSGHKTVLINFEDKKEEMMAKQYACLTGRYTKEFINVPKEQVSEMMEAIWKEADVPNAKELLSANFRLKKMDAVETSLSDIVAYLRHKVKAQGWKPDMIFIDYLSCLKLKEDGDSSRKQEYEMMERAMRRLTTIAQEFDIAIWVAQQTNTMGLKKQYAEESGQSKVQGGGRILQPASVIISIDRFNCNNDINRANLHLEKCRGGEPTNWEGIFMNNGTCQIILSDAAESVLPWDNEEDLSKYKL